MILEYKAIRDSKFNLDFDLIADIVINDNPGASLEKLISIWIDNIDFYLYKFGFPSGDCEFISDYQYSFIENEVNLILVKKISQ